MTLNSAISLVDAILPKLLMHEERFKSSKEEGVDGRFVSVAYVAYRKGSKERGHGKDES